MDVDAIIKKTPDLERSVEKIKKEFLDYLNHVFVQYTFPAGHGQNFKKKITSAAATLSELEKSITDVTKQGIQTVEINVVNYKKTLVKIKEEIDILNHLISIDELLLEVDNLFENQKYLDVIKLMKKIEKELDVLRSIENLNILDNIQRDINLKLTLLFSTMNEDICKTIKYKSEKKIVSFTIINGNLLKELLLAYAENDDHIQILSDIARFLWKSILCSIINCSVKIKTSTDTIKSLQLEVLNKTKSPFKVVFENLKIVIDFLDKYFKFPLKIGSTLQYIGNDIKDNLSELIIKNCLNDTIPNTSDEFQNYHLIIEEVKELEKILIESGLFSNDMHYLSSHVKNVDNLYVQKICESKLRIAKELMKKDLHDMIEVGEPVDLNNPFKIDLDVFYQRSVSKCCIDLVNFTENIFKQIVNNDYNTAKALYETVTNIFGIYSDTVSNHHKKLLETIPQQVALFLNNCNYISYKIMKFEEIYGNKMKSILNIEDLFSFEIYSLRSKGDQMFNEFINQQINEMEQIMNESGLVNVTTLEKLEPITEKSIQHCLRQQELLRTAWNKVLSHTDYNKNLGKTLNFLCKTIIDAVLKYTDINSDAKDQLVDVLKVIFTRGPKLFAHQTDVSVHVDQWHKLNELSFLLSANLLEISDRWADGKGPLALHFKGEELKNLIRALYQNSDIRAAVLSKIQ
ncbi:centromere/kinetochore protein zw10 homolog [Onthophagus taurus]|uniref:centromere/kinetochore protein zw10 homolog n=1 Tax=Onthophagus taurus TaxID=166361 RepID=UPI0039BE57A7